MVMGDIFPLNRDRDRYLTCRRIFLKSISTTNAVN
jgi:hypothetical protein